MHVLSLGLPLLSPFSWPFSKTMKRVTNKVQPRDDICKQCWMKQTDPLQLNSFNNVLNSYATQLKLEPELLKQIYEWERHDTMSNWKARKLPPRADLRQHDVLRGDGRVF